jgi:hypothetical protein
MNKPLALLSPSVARTRPQERCPAAAVVVALL